MKFNLWNEKYKVRIFCYILIISSIPIIILGIYAYQTYMKSISSNVSISTQSTVYQVKDKVDTVLTNIRKGYLESVEEASVLWLLNEDIKYSDYSELVEAGSILSGPSYYSDFIEGYTFINYDTHWVLSNRGMFPYELVTNKESVKEIWENTNTSYTREYWISNLTTDNFTLKREEINLRNISLVMKLPMIKKNPHSLLIVNLNMRNLENFIYQDTGIHDMTVLDHNGQVIFSSNSELGSALSHEYKNSFDSLNHSLIQNTIDISQKDGQKQTHYISAIPSDAMDWYYIASYNKDLILTGGNNIIVFTVIMLGIVLFVIAIALLFTHNLYRPIRRLSNYITGGQEGVTFDKGSSNNQKEGKMDGEFLQIVTKMNTLKDNTHLLQEKLQSQLPQILELFQLRLLRGELSGQQLNNYMNNLKLNGINNYILMVINIKSQNGFEVFDEAKQDVLRMDIIEHMPSSILEYLYFPPICNLKTIVFTIKADNKDDEDIIDVYKKLEEYIYRKYGYKMNGGTSFVKNTLNEYPYAYQESITALRTNDLFGDKLIEDHHEIIFYKDVQPSIKGFIYDKVLERELKESIDMGELEKSFQFVDNFIDSISNSNLSPHDLTLSLHRLVLSIVLVGSNSGLPLNSIFEEGISSLFIKLNQLYDVNKVRSYLKYEIIQVIIEKLEVYRASKSSTIMFEIQKIIDKSNGDITLTECAQQLGFHSTYIWKVMKLEKNTTFSSYVSEYKLEQAKKLLRETTMTVAEIAAKLNYTNAQNFIRFFSKLEGITPGKYRQGDKK